MLLKKRLPALLLSGAVLLGMLSVRVSAARLPFVDVSSADWFYTGVKYCYDNRLMDGTGNGYFEPNVTTTRAMVVTILYKLDGAPAVTTWGTFSDVPDYTWYSDPVEWAAAAGIVSGYGDGRFGPGDTITREQLATILYTYSKYKRHDVSAGASLDSYEDAWEISDWAKEAMAWANARGMITGVTPFLLEPHGGATRAQVAAVLMHFRKK